MSDPRYCDSSRDGSTRLTNAQVGSCPDFSFTTLDEVARDGGWDRIQRPVGGDPRELVTEGMRGETGDFDVVNRDGTGRLG